MRFRIILFSLLASITGYLFWSLVLPFPELWARIAVTAILIALIACILWVPLVSWQSDRETTTAGERVFFWIAFSAVGFLSCAFTLALLKDASRLIWGSRVSSPEITLATWGLALGVFLAGVWRAHRVTVQRVRVPIRDLAPELEGLKLAQISDLHVGPTIRRAFVERVVKLINAESVDLVLLTGDLADGSPADLRAETEPLGRIQAKLGRFYVPGNHEYYWGAPAWIAEITRLGFTPLVNAHQLLSARGQSLAVVGVNDPTDQTNGPDFKRATQGLAANTHPWIALCHQPDFASEAEAAGCDLLLCGHTHGGQFFPWTLVAAGVHRHNVGLHRLKTMWIYVSRGTGYWGPPIRIGSPPEVTVLELFRAEK